MEAELPLAKAFLDTRLTPMPHPRSPRPIVVVGAGGIVRTAHLAAYEKAGFPVIGILDQDAVRFAPKDAVFDLAVPASQFVRILPQLVDGSSVLLQKPMGETLQEAAQIREICRTKRLVASVNFTLRYAPNHLGIRLISESGRLGEIHDLHAQVCTYTPWHLWSFLAKAPRLEILYHSIHYFDLIRAWFGNPLSVAAKTVKSPLCADLAATKTIAILDYGESTRVFVATNHSHDFGPAHQESYVQWEGTKGAARITMGVNLDYPAGKPDRLEFAERGARAGIWVDLPISGNCFPDAFMGPMGALQAYAEGSAGMLPTHIEDAFQTMALVEALYESSNNAGRWTSLPQEGN